MAEAKWSDLIDEPLAVVGPYAGETPPLSSFAPHSFRADFDVFALAGQFLELPANPPGSWNYDGTFRAYALFEFEAKDLNIAGELPRGNEDDALHGRPVGEVGRCMLRETETAFLTFPDDRRPLYWKHFSLEIPGFRLSLLAGSIRLYLGRRAMQQYGWSPVSNSSSSGRVAGVATAAASWRRST